MLRTYVSPMQDDWVKHLSLLELAYNSAKGVSTSYSPFEMIYAQPHDILDRLMGGNSDTSDAGDFLESVKSRLNEARSALTKAAELQKKYYDANHSEIPAYKPNDWVTLRLDLHPTAAVRFNKLSPQKLKPMRVVRVLSNGRALELDLPEGIVFHPVVSVQHVEKCENPDEDPWKRGFERPGPVLIDDGDWFEAEIVAKRLTPKGKPKYRVAWKGYPLEQAKWLAEKDVAQGLIKEFEHREKQRPPISSASDKFTYSVIPPPPGKSVERAISYIARNTKPFERNYESTERELACAVWAFVRLRHMLEGSETILVTDHSSIREVITSPVSVQYSLRIDKFRMLLALYVDKIKVFYRPGKDHTNVDPLSCACWLSDPNSPNTNPTPRC